jgi:WD40 repeat protein
MLVFLSQAPCRFYSLQQPGWIIAMGNQGAGARAESPVVSRWATLLGRSGLLGRLRSAKTGRSLRFRPGRVVPSSGYAAFISYSHAVDGMLAPALQRGLHRFAKPWYRLRAVRVFRDEASLSANPGLWSSIEAALAASQFFILMASPQGARSPWVAREASYWCRHKRSTNLLIALTDGELVWDSAAHDFDWAMTTALPPSMRGVFAEEPRFIDLRWARTEQHLSLAHPRFRDCVADLAAPLHGQAKDELIGEDVRQYRRTKRTVRSVVTALATLTALSVLASMVAVTQRNEARAQTRVAVSTALAALARSEAIARPDFALLVAVQANRVENTLQARAGLQEVLQRNQRLHGFLRPPPNAKSLGLGVTAFSPDGKSVAAAGGGDDDGRVFVWDTASRQPRWTPPEGGNGAVTALAFSPDGALLAAGTFSGDVQLWNARTGRPIGPPVIQGLPSVVTSVSFGTSDRTLTAIDGVGNVQRWTAGKGVASLKPSGSPATLNGDGSVVAAATRDGGFSVVTLPSARQIGHGTHLISGDAEGIALSMNSRRVALGARGQVVLADLAGHAIARLPLGTAERIGALALSRDGRFLAVVTAQTGKNAALQIWDTTIKARLGAPLDTRQPDLLSVAMTADGRFVATARGGDVLVWNSEWGPALANPVYITEEVANAVASHDGRMVAAGDLAGHVDLIDIKTRKVLRKITVGGEDEVPQPMTFSPTGDAFAISIGARTILTALAPSGPGPVAVPGGRLAFSPDGKLIASFGRPNGSDSGNIIQVYDRVSVRPRGNFQAIPDEERIDGGPGTGPIMFSPDGRFVATGGMGGVAIWPVDGSSAPRLLRYDRNTAEQFAPRVLSMTSTLDARTLVVGTEHGHIVAWDWLTGHRVGLEIPEQDRPITALAFSPNGGVLAVGHHDGIIRLLDLASRQQIGSALTGPHTDNLDTSRQYFNADGVGVPVDIGQLVFTDGGRSLVAVSGDSTTVWQLDTTAWEHLACAIAGRTLTTSEWGQLLAEQSYEPACRDGRLNTAG